MIISYPFNRGDIMIARLSKRIAYFFVERSIIQAEDEDVYIYGLQLLFSSVFNGLIAIIVALASGTVIQSIVFLTAFVVMRKSAGGYHAKTHLGCCCILIVVMCMFITILKLVSERYFYTITIVSVIFSIIMVLIYAPLEHKNKPLSNTDKLRLRKKSKLYILIITVLTIILGFLRLKHVMVSAALGIMTSSCSIAVAKLKKQS